ncbi:MAG: DUF3575 domain-containing protein [Firmicutes bacterium]|nr:DUF3575 domain-containing protein [Bacillota bacterium]
MKRVLTLISLSLVLILLVANVSMAAEEQTVTVNPFGLLFGIFNATYEKSLHHQNSFLINGSYLSWEILGDKITAFGVGGGYRQYLGGEDFSGFFGQGTAGVVFASAPGVSTTGANVVGLVGFKWIFNHGFTVEAGAGGQMIFGKLEGYSSWSGFSPALMLSLGYSW